MLFPAVFLRPMKSASMDSCNDPWSLLNIRQNIIQTVWINATWKFSKIHDLEDSDNEENSQTATSKH